MQPLEFEQQWDGYRWRQEQQENLMAYFTACQMSVHTKKPVSPRDILKPLRQPPKNKKADEAVLREMFKDRLPGGG